MPRPRVRGRQRVAVFVPPGFEPPPLLGTSQFRLEPLGPEHNEADYAAWTSSIDHIKAMPGFEDAAGRTG